MRISVSNIAWSAEQDREMLPFLRTLGFDALEIAPTRLFPENPYEQPPAEIECCAKSLKETYGLTICSMQSIWFGRSERIAGSREEYNALLDYTEKAALFARVMGCRNLVFGCPKNRRVDTARDEETVKRFLDEASSRTYAHNVTLALEANPKIYHTNFANSTEQAIQIIRELNNPGLKLNLDFGTILENGESVRVLEDSMDLISHVHISEPYLKPVRHRKEHSDLKQMLLINGYQQYISLEMGAQDSLETLKSSLEYIKEVFD